MPVTVIPRTDTLFSQGSFIIYEGENVCYKFMIGEAIGAFKWNIAKHYSSGMSV